MSTQPPFKGPLERHLDPVLDDARIQKINRGVQAARHLPVPSAMGRWTLAAVAVVTLALATWTLLPVEPQPLRLADGSPLPAIFPAAQSAQRLKLSDGSVMSLEANAAAEVVANQPGKLTMLIRKGRARFEVNPRAQRQWLVEAGVATVEVVGTIFTVDRDAQGVRVSVERGIVLVRSDQLPDHLQRLEAGATTFVSARPTEPTAQPTHLPALEPTAPPLPAVLDVRPPAVVPPVAVSGWRKAAAAGDFTTAWAALERAGFGAAVTAASHSDELLALADTARSTGHDVDAANALKRLLAIAPTDANGATAAFTLGRIELEKLSRPAEAAAHFQQAAAHPAMGPLVEDALARRVEALWAAGQKDEALEAAGQVLDRFPKGAHADQLQRWREDPAHEVPWPR